MASEPRHYEKTKQGIATFFQVNERQVYKWAYLEEAAVILDDGEKVYCLSTLAALRHKRIQDAQASRRVAKGASAVTYSDKKDREQAWTLRYKRLEVSGQLLSKPRVQSALRRWAMSFPGPLKEFVAYVVAMVPGPQKAAVKKQGLEAIAQCMSSVKDMATAFDTDIDLQMFVEKPVKRKRATKKRTATKRKA